MKSFTLLLFLPVLTMTILLFAEGGGPAEGQNAATTEFRFSVLPTYNTIRYRILSPPSEAGAWKLALTREGDTAVLAEKAGQFPFTPVGDSLAIPRLTNGTYTLILTLTGGEKPLVIERKFTRTVQPWENNTLGKDRSVIIPPFTPLTVDEKSGTVGCILRSHRMGEAGLWRQVTSRGKDILDSPMMLEVESAGKKYHASHTRTAFTMKEGFQVTGTSSWNAGPVRGTTGFCFDYDGMMKVTLRIEPTTERVDRMALVIPMKAEEAWLMHEVTDLLRDHYTGKIPAGEGKVWDSAKVARYQLPGPFVPYIWLGGTERGVCWFADNDRDWITDEKTPAIEIIRVGDTVSLRVNFITRSSAITRPRTLVFGLMATPAKPMPDTPRNWRTWWEQIPQANGEHVNLQFIGSCYYFGAQAPCIQYYPAFHNYSVFEEFAKVKKTGVIDPTFIKTRWLPQFEGQTFYTDQMRTLYEAHINYMFNQLKANWTKKQADARNILYLIPYTNARGVIWDGDTRNFMDEWTIFDIADPRWNVQFMQDNIKENFPRFIRGRESSYTMMDGFYYQSDPVESYCDMALWYQKRMYETFSDGVYYDDCFFHANSNPVPGPGYVGDDGKLHPGVGFFALRDFIRRTAVMQYQLGLRPMIYLHMTNTNMVPILSFGTINLDWEWRDQGDYASKDLQDRLEADRDTSLILAQSTGLQSGNVTVSIDRFHPPKDSNVTREWLMRTQLAVAIPHEMKPAGHDEVVYRVINLLTDFGYGSPESRVYRYWDKQFPVVVTGAQVKPLVVSRVGKTLLFFGSFGVGGETMVKLDLDKLGLPASVQAKNGETGLSVRKDGPGVFSFPIRKHDFQILVVE